MPNFHLLCGFCSASSLNLSISSIRWSHMEISPCGWPICHRSYCSLGSCSLYLEISSGYSIRSFVFPSTSSLELHAYNNVDRIMILIIGNPPLAFASFLDICWFHGRTRNKMFSYVPLPKLSIKLWLSPVVRLFAYVGSL